VNRLTVSFCIPTHGRSRLLLEALESALTQRRQPDEIVVSDDLGDDKTRSVVTEFAGQAPFPVRYVHCTTSSNQAANVNNCLHEAKCDLVIILHDDDLLLPLARAFEENPGLVSAFGKQKFITDGGAEMAEYTERVNRAYHRDEDHVGIQPDAILSGIQQQFPNDGFMVKASVARKVLYRPETRAATDFDFGIRMGEKGQFYFVNEYTTTYRFSAESVGRGDGKKSDDSGYQGMLILMRLLETCPHHEAEIETALRNLAPMGVRMAANAGHLKQAVEWYFGPYHARRLLTPGGMRTGFLLLETWLKEKFGASSNGASPS
jgi:glycosyltransferase involved in cell wall biosynthesis